MITKFWAILSVCLVLIAEVRFGICINILYCLTFTIHSGICYLFCYYYLSFLLDTIDTFLFPLKSKHFLLNTESMA